MATTSVDGLISGLSTSSVIEQLMAVEKQGQTRLSTKRTAVQAEVTGLQAVNSAFAALGEAAKALARPAAWQSHSATSSDAAVATATANGAAAPGSFAFTVTRLAAAASKISAAGVAGTSSIVATGPLTISKGGGAAVPIDVGDGSLASVVSAINASPAGVRAAAVEVSAGTFKLQLTSTTAGAASDFTVDGSLGSLGALGELTAAADASLTVGSGAGAYVITSASNTVTALPGVSIALRGTGAATVEVAVDPGAIADKLQKVVDAANAARSAISSRSGYDAAAKKAGVLLGDGGVRRLVGGLAEAVSGTGSTPNPGVAGIALARDGTVTFDRATFLSAFAADPAGIADRLGQGARTGTGGVALANAGPRARAGVHSVVVTSPATRAERTGAAVATLGAQTLELRVGTATATYEVADGADLATVATGLNAAAATAGLGVAVGVEAGRLAIRTSAYGSAATFEVRSTATDSGLVSGSAWEAVAGTDVAGTIDGVAATGVGRLLSGAATSTAADLTLEAPASGTIDFQPGLLQRLSALAEGATNRTDGTLTSGIAARQGQVASLTGSISAWDIRLSLREASIRKQYSGLETALGALKNQSTWLAGQLSRL